MVAHGADHDTMDMSGMDGMYGMEGMDMSTGAGGMAMAFFQSSTTSLWSKAWTPTNAGQYAGTCIFLIFLAVALRAIFTAKTLLEARAVQTAVKRRYITVAGEKAIGDSDASSTTGILTTNGIQENVRIVSAPVSHIQPWRFGTDLPRAVLVMIAVGVGYLL
ncbi:hypothetical protein PTT_12811 [Pyrenophora teres f. teres 0-1]|uniref:Copper transport protein n=1 Tax=Pyrenophora teres f. teres (strain 0-1) TaxID=861557 RepID=E3RUN4_PYRTT|nr:hypothetical protein PTT_12811 [Pyrenophora teres f. teres 0-1]